MRDRRKKRRLFWTALFAAAALSGTAFGAEKETGPGWEAVKETKETGTSETSRAVLVETENAGESEAAVTYYRKENGNWEAVFSVSGLVGRAGTASPEEKREGDKKTPAGVYGFTAAFGILDDPGSAMEYHKLENGDVWVDDPDSVHYNRMVNANETEKDWDSAENLAAMSPWYHYCLALSYNEEQVPGKGSAIFLHCEREGDDGTSGCIAIPEENMELLIKELDESAKIIIR